MTASRDAMPAGVCARSLRGAALALGGDQADGDEGEEEGRRQVVGAEGGDDEAVERAQALGERRRPTARAAHLGVGLDGGDEGLADERPGHRQEQPPGARGEQLPPLQGERARTALGEREEHLLDAALRRAPRPARAARRASPPPPPGRRRGARSGRRRGAASVSWWIERKSVRPRAASSRRSAVDLPRLAEVEPVERLVEQQQRLRREQPESDEETLALALRKRAHGRGPRRGRSWRASRPGAHAVRRPPRGRGRSEHAADRADPATARCRPGCRTARGSASRRGEGATRGAADLAGVGGSRPARHSKSVVLPAPLGPMRPSTSPGRTVRLDRVEHRARAVALGRARARRGEARPASSI